MNILVIGSSSYLGTNLINFYNSKNYECFGASRNKADKINYKHILFNNEFNLKKILTENDIEVIFYCLNSYFKNPSLKQTNEMLEINYKTPLRLIDDINDSSLETKFINFSSYFNFFEVPIESQEYKNTKLLFSNWLRENNNNNIKELVISDTFGSWDTRNKIFNIILKNCYSKKIIEFTNPNNFINLICIDKLIEYIDIFINSLNNSEVFTSKFSIRVDRLNDLIKNLILDKECIFEDYFSYETRFNVEKSLYGEDTIADIMNVIKNIDYKKFLTFND